MKQVCVYPMKQACVSALRCSLPNGSMAEPNNPNWSEIATSFTLGRYIWRRRAVCPQIVTAKGNGLVLGVLTGVLVDSQFSCSC